MLGFVAAVAVATTLAVVSALTPSTSGAIAHDFWFNCIKRGPGRQQARGPARTRHAVAIGVLAIAPGILAQGVNVAVLVILAICVSASANLLFLLLFREIQYRWHDVKVRIVGGTGDDRTGNARRRSIVAAGRFLFPGSYRGRAAIDFCRDKRLNHQERRTP
jgi:sodium:solute symporter family protein